MTSVILPQNRINKIKWTFLCHNWKIVRHKHNNFFRNSSWNTLRSLTTSAVIRVTASVQLCGSVMSVGFNCGFARVAVKESWHKVGSSSIETHPCERRKNYLGIFEEDSQDIFDVECSTYIKKSKAVDSSFQKMNSKSRSEYINTLTAN